MKIKSSNSILILLLILTIQPLLIHNEFIDISTQTVYNIYNTKINDFAIRFTKPTKNCFIYIFLPNEDRDLFFKVLVEIDKKKTLNKSYVPVPNDLTYMEFSIVIEKSITIIDVDFIVINDYDYKNMILFNQVYLLKLITFGKNYFFFHVPMSMTISNSNDILKFQIRLKNQNEIDRFYLTNDNFEVTYCKKDKDYPYYEIEIKKDYSNREYIFGGMIKLTSILDYSYVDLLVKNSIDYVIESIEDSFKVSLNSIFSNEELYIRYDFRKYKGKDISIIKPLVCSNTSRSSCLYKKSHQYDDFFTKMNVVSDKTYVSLNDNYYYIYFLIRLNNNTSKTNDKIEFFLYINVVLKLITNEVTNPFKISSNSQVLLEFSIRKDSNTHIDRNYLYLIEENKQESLSNLLLKDFSSNGSLNGRKDVSSISFQEIFNSNSTDKVYLSISLINNSNKDVDLFIFTKDFSKQDRFRKDCLTITNQIYDFSSKTYKKSSLKFTFIDIDINSKEKFNLQLKSNNIKSIVLVNNNTLTESNLVDSFIEIDYKQIIDVRPKAFYFKSDLDLDLDSDEITGELLLIPLYSKGININYIQTFNLNPIGTINFLFVYSLYTYDIYFDIVNIEFEYKDIYYKKIGCTEDKTDDLIDYFPISKLNGEELTNKVITFDDKSSCLLVSIRLNYMNSDTNPDFTYSKITIFNYIYDYINSVKDIHYTYSHSDKDNFIYKRLYITIPKDFSYTSDMIYIYTQYTSSLIKSFEYSPEVEGDFEKVENGVLVIRPNFDRKFIKFNVVFLLKDKENHKENDDESSFSIRIIIMSSNIQSNISLNKLPQYEQTVFKLIFNKNLSFFLVSDVDKSKTNLLQVRTSLDVNVLALNDKSIEVYSNKTVSNYIQIQFDVIGNSRMYLFILYLPLLDKEIGLNNDQISSIEVKIKAQSEENEVIRFENNSIISYDLRSSGYILFQYINKDDYNNIVKVYIESGSIKYKRMLIYTESIDNKDNIKINSRNEVKSNIKEMYLLGNKTIVNIIFDLDGYNPNGIRLLIEKTKRKSFVFFIFLIVFLILFVLIFVFVLKKFVLSLFTKESEESLSNKATFVFERRFSGEDGNN